MSGGLDRRGLEQLYVRIEKPLYNVVYRWVWDARDAQDIVQEAFVRVWQMRDRVEMATVEALVYRIALNQAWKQRRWKRIRTFLGVERDHADPRPGADHELAEDARGRRVRAAIEVLPAKEREVVALCVFSEMTQGDIGRTLGVPPGTVASRKNRAYARLREMLGEDADELT